MTDDEDRATNDGASAALANQPDSERTLLIVDDDEPLCQRLARAMERRGFIVQTADSVASGMRVAGDRAPAFAVVDLRLGDGSGLEIVKVIRRSRPGARIVMLTGYGNIATAVAAVKAGAVDYLPIAAAPRRSDVRGPGALGAYPACVRAMRP